MVLGKRFWYFFWGYNLVIVFVILLVRIKIFGIIKCSCEILIDLFIIRNVKI